MSSGWHPIGSDIPLVIRAEGNRGACNPGLADLQNSFVLIPVQLGS